MDIFSIKRMTYQLTKENYMKATNKRKPYFQGKSYFAICPCCKNPIQIINLFKEDYEERITRCRKLHARHVPRSVLGVAEYNRERYDSCELHNPIAFGLMVLRENQEQNQELRELIERNKKEISYDIKEITGIYFKNQKLIKNVIDPFIDRGNHCYTYIHRFNIPYVILYTEESIDIYGQILNIDNEIGKEIYLSIKRNSNFFRINEEEKRIEKKEGITFFTKIFLMIHGHNIRNGFQTVSMRIFEEGNNRENTILKRTLRVKSFIYN